MNGEGPSRGRRSQPYVAVREAHQQQRVAPRGGRPHHALVGGHVQGRDPLAREVAQGAVPGGHELVGPAGGGGLLRRGAQLPYCTR